MKKSSLFKKVVVFGTLFIMIFSLVSCGDSETATSKPKDDKKTEQKKENKTEFSQDEVAIYKDVNYTITKVSKSLGDEFNKPKDGKEFVIISLKIENKSDKKVSYNPFYWKIENGNGQEEDQSIFGADNDTSLESGDLKSGGFVEGTICFEAPKGDNNLKLNFYDNALFDEKPAFQFKIK